MKAALSFPPPAFPLIQQPGRQPRVLRVAWALVTLALWGAYGYLAVPVLLAHLPFLAATPVAWIAHPPLDTWLLWVVALGATGAASLLVVWTELDSFRQRRRPPRRLLEVHANAIARGLHASETLHRQLAGARNVRLHLDEQARPVRAEIMPLPALQARRRRQTGARVCPSPRTTKRSTVKASRPIGP